VERLGLRDDGDKQKIRSNEKGWLDNNICSFNNYVISFGIDGHEEAIYVI
jgi:hypothetical protein